MYIGLKLHFGSQGDSSSRKGCSVRLFDGETQVWRLDIVCYFVAQLRKKLAYHIVPGKSLSVLHLEELFPNRALGIDKEISGSRHSFVLTDGLGVQDLIGPYSLRIRIVEDRKFDVVPVS